MAIAAAFGSEVLISGKIVFAPFSLVRQLARSAYELLICQEEENGTGMDLLEAISTALERSPSAFE